jgi:transposase
VAQVRPRPAPEPVVRFETAPGEQAQFDFAEVKFPWGKRWVLLVVLGYSRLLYAEFVARQTALTVMLGLERVALRRAFRLRSRGPVEVRQRLRPHLRRGLTAATATP